MIAAFWKNDLRHFLILLNFIAFSVLIVYLLVSVLSPKRVRREEREAPNIVPFLPDEDLEGRRLERVQGWALIFAAVIAIALPIYWLREPTRQDQTVTYFDKNAEHRGAVLFASPGGAEYEAATSKQCANCHGDKGQGGVAPSRIGGEPVNWKAPPLNTEALRFTEEPACADPSLRQPTTECEISDIITYGRPGTPMQGWGISGGGPLNDQGIADLVAFIKSIQLSPAQAQKQAADAIAVAKNPNPGPSDTCPEYMSCPAIATKDARAAVAAARKTLGEQAEGHPCRAPASRRDRRRPDGALRRHRQAGQGQSEQCRTGAQDEKPSPAAASSTRQRRRRTRRHRWHGRRTGNRDARTSATGSCCSS